MRLHEVEQTSDRTILEPSLCGECGDDHLDYFKKNQI